MSLFVVLAIGAVVVAIAVYAFVTLGGLKMTKESILEEDQFRRRVDDDQVDDGLPTDAKF